MLTGRNASASNVARNDLVRLFYREDCSDKYTFLNCVALDGLSQDQDVTDVWCPRDDVYGQFERVAVIRGEKSRLTSTLTSRMSRTDLSLFYSLFRQGCPTEIKVNFGKCNDPTDGNDFEKAIFLNDVYFTSYGTDPLVVMNPGDRNVINETMDLSAGTMYEVVSINTTISSVLSSYFSMGPIIDNSITLYSPNCSSCPDGYYFYLQYRVTNCGGDASIEPYLIYSLDGGITFNDLSLANLFELVGLDCTVDTVLLEGASINFDGANVVISTGNAQFFLSIAQIANGSTGAYNVANLGVGVALDADTYFKTNYAVGTNGLAVRVSSVYDTFVYGTNITTALFSVAAISENLFIAGGEAGVFLVGNLESTEIKPIVINGVTVVSDIYNVEAISDTCYLASSGGTLYIGSKSGDSWKIAKTFSGQCISDIKMVTRSLGYLVTNNPTTQLPSLYRTTDGGHNWKKIAMASGIVAGTILTKIDVSINDINQFIVSGWIPANYPADPCSPLNVYDPADGDTGIAIYSY